MKDGEKEKSTRRRSFGNLSYRKDTKAWVVRVPTGRKTKSGRTSYKTYPFPRKKQAVMFLRDLEKARAAGTLVVGDGATSDRALTLAAAVDEYIDVKVAEGRSPRTVTSYQSLNVRLLHTESPLHGLRADQVRPEDVEAYMAWRREHVFYAHRTRGGQYKDGPAVHMRKGATASNGTINRDLALLSAALNRLVRLGRLSENPVSRIRRPKEAKGARIALSKEEVRRLVATCDDRLRPLVITALFTGARISELRRLRWGDIGFDSKTITLRRAKVGNVGAIPLHPVLEEELRRHRGSATRIPRSNSPVFPAAKGDGPIQDFRRPWNRALRAAGLGDREGVSFHSLRQYADFRTMPTSLAG